MEPLSCHTPGWVSLRESFDFFEQITHHVQAPFKLMLQVSEIPFQLNSPSLISHVACESLS